MRGIKIMLFVSLILIPLAAQNSYDQLAEGFYLRTISVPIQGDLIRLEAEKPFPLVHENYGWNIDSGLPQICNSQSTAAPRTGWTT